MPSASSPAGGSAGRDAPAVGGHAIVLGASLAGLLAAGALARHVDRVTVVERDELPDGEQWRRGLPQAHHAHNLMTAGHAAMERLLPGIRRELLEAGMVSVAMPEDMLLLTAAGWMPRFPTGLAMLTGSRPVIDAVVRRRLGAHPRVSIVQRTQVVGLLSARNGSRITGVFVREREPATGALAPQRELTADLVVDATGRTSRLPQWLADLGRHVPEPTVVDARTAYATCVFEPPAGHDADWKCILLQYAPGSPRQGILNPIEGGRWMVSLAALGGAVPPTDLDGFLRFSATLRSPVLHDALRDATPMTPIRRSGRTENRWVHYERVDRWPERLVVVGDAAGAFNPSYGQGMSVAASSAVALDALLSSRRSLDGLGHLMQRAVAKRIAVAWAIAATADLKYPWASGRVDLRTRLALHWLYRVIGACPSSTAAARALLDINQLVATPAAVLRPAVVTAALRPSRRPVAPSPPAREAPLPLALVD
ncbi:MAG: NAD(P)/FAD-dependent oxidoreductase [Frankiaceae bacterium]